MSQQSASMSDKQTTYVILLGAVALALVLAISGFSIWSAIKYKESEDWRDHSTEVLSKISLLQSLIERAETAQRGYVLTGSERYLEPYAHSEKSAKETLAEIRQLVSDNVVQYEHTGKIYELLVNRVETLEQPIRLMKENKPQEAVKFVRNGIGQDLMERLRSEIDTLAKRESELLSKRTDRATRDFDIASWLTFFGLICAFTILVAVTVLLKMQISHRIRITEQLKEAEMRANEASALKSRFLANMSHEIRTPLNGIIGMTKLLSATKVTKEQESFISPLIDSSNFLLSLINQILDFSKIESGKLQLEEMHFELRSLVQSTRSMIQGSAKDKGLEIITAVDEAVPDLYLGDPLRIRQILLNLLGNAIKFSSNGRVEVIVSVVVDHGSDARVKFEVVDHGIGMADDIQARLFESFSQGDQSMTRRFGGTGLGLSITKQLVEMMNGSIQVQSAPNAGSRFTFDLLLKKAKYEEAEAIRDKHSDSEAKIDAFVLIVEDNAINQKVVSAMLREIGCKAQIAGNGEEAIRALQNDVFDLVLMDGQMPVMDGYEASRLIRSGSSGERNRNIPIIAVTANAIKGDRERCLEAGMNDYIPKPISQSDLRIKVKKWLKAGSSAIDYTMIDNLHQMESEDHPNLALEIIQMFLDMAPGVMAKLRAAHSEGDFVLLSREAHSFKSSCANVGAVRMQEIAARIEKIKGPAEAEMLNSLLSTLEREFVVVESALRNYKAA